MWRVIFVFRRLAAVRLRRTLFRVERLGVRWEWGGVREGLSEGSVTLSVPWYFIYSFDVINLSVLRTAFFSLMVERWLRQQPRVHWVCCAADDSSEGRGP